MRGDSNNIEGGRNPLETTKFEKKWMRFRGIRLVEQTEQKFRRIRDCLEEKTSNSRALLSYKSAD